MDRKPPALTSPWKVGFLVALMLAVTGLGVGYFISGTFGLKWNWIDLAGSSPSTWSFHLGAFAEEMLPLLLIVTVLALASYVLVAGAVTRYTRYVDSGVEYKQLLRSIKTVDDLEDGEYVEKLKEHPELRDFLMGFKNRMAAREKQLLEREKRGGAARETERAGHNLTAESALLVSALMNGKSGFSAELALTTPELKQIERAAREQLSREDTAATELEALRTRLNSTLESVRSRAGDVRRESVACLAGVREMERMLQELKQAVGMAQEPAVATKGIATAAKQLDAVSDALAELSEQTRRVAIAAALQASGGSTEGDAIQIAEEVRVIATRFNTVASQWREASPALRTGITTLEKGGSANSQRRESLSLAVAAAATKAQMWGERLVALQEQVRDLEQAAGGEAEVEPAREWGTIDTNFDDDAPVGSYEEAVAALDVEAPEETTVPEPAVEPAIDEEDAVVECTPGADGGEEAVDDDDEFVTGSPPSVFEEDSDEDGATFVDLPGFEKEQRVFNDHAASRSGVADDDSELDVEQNGGGQTIDDEPLDEHVTAGAAPEQPNGDEGFLTGPRGPKKSKAPETPAETKMPRSPKPALAPSTSASRVATLETEADTDAVDLYRLGAVDFIEGVHA